MLICFSSASPEDAIREINVSLDQAVALSPNVGPFPDNPVGIDEDAFLFRNSREGTRLERMRWGFPPRSLTNRNGWNRPISQVHDLEDRWWQQINRAFVIEARYRCLIPFSAFAIRHGRHLKWISAEGRVGFFAGFWRPWEGDTRLIESSGSGERHRVPGRLSLFAILATGPPGCRRSDALPTVLNEPGDIANWMMGGEESLDMDS